MKSLLFRVGRCVWPTLLAVTLATAAYSQQDFSGRLVTSVLFQPAKQPIDERDLKDMQLIRVGEPLVPSQVAATIDHLFASGLYDDIQVDAEPDQNGVSIRFITRARLFVGHVGARGKFSDPPSRGAILSHAQLYLGTPFNPEDVETATKRVLQIMRDNGLYTGAAGAATILDRETNQVTIRFLVNSGKRAHYETPTIRGDTKLADSTIIRATGWRIPIIHYWRQVTSALTDKGIDGIEKKYAKQQRLTASVDVDSLDYDSRNNRVKPTLKIDAGPKITIRALEAKLKRKKLEAFVPVFQEGSVDNDLLTEGAGNIKNYFQSRGYPDVEVTFKTEPEKNDEEIIDYYIALGPRRRLVHIDILGNDYFTLETIRERMFLQTNSLALRYGRYSATSGS